MTQFENNANKDKMMKSQKVFLSVKTIGASSRNFPYISRDAHVDITDISFNANNEDDTHIDGYGYGRYEFENVMEIFNDPNMYQAFIISKDLVADLEDSLRSATEANDEKCVDILSVYLHCLDYLDIDGPVFVRKDKIGPHDDVRFMIIPADYAGAGFNAFSSAGNSFIFGTPICVYGIEKDAGSARSLINEIIYNQIVKYAENRAEKIKAAERTGFHAVPDPWRDKSEFPMHLLREACTCKNYPSSLDINKLISSMYLDMGLEQLGSFRADYSQMINDIRHIAASLAILKITAKCASNRRFRDKFVYVPYNRKSWAIPGGLMDAFIDIWSDNVYSMKNPIFNPIRPVPTFNPINPNELGDKYLRAYDSMFTTNRCAPSVSEGGFPEGYKPLESYNDDDAADIEDEDDLDGDVPDNIAESMSTTCNDYNEQIDDEDAAD